jgi:PAS domain S-box-containing protein
MTPADRTFGRWRAAPWIIYVISALILIAGAGIILQNEAAYRAQAEQEARAQAETLAAAVTAALDFRDAAVAKETIDAFAVNRRVRTIAVYDAAGVLLAGFQRTASDTPSPRLGNTRGDGGNLITATVKVAQAGAQLGTVHLTSERDPLTQRIGRYAILGLLVALVALVVTVLGTAQNALRQANAALRGQADELARTNAVLQTEIAERERAEAATRELDALYRAYVENTSEALFVLDVTPEGEFVFLSTNPANAETNGFTTELVRGRRPSDIFEPEVARALEENYRRCVIAGTVQSYSEQVPMPSGLRQFETVLVPLRDADGRVFRIMGSGRDMTERARLEEALRQSQKMEAVGQLTGGIAHDFNNLLGAVVGNLDLIRRMPENDVKVRRWAESGLQAAERGAKLTGQLLAFSRAQRLHLQAVDAAALVDGMREMLASTLGPMVQIEFELQARGVPVLADPTQLEMAVLNLAINARDAMEPGGTLTIGAATACLASDHELADGEYMKLSVRDTGAGMPPDVLARALDPFFTTKDVGKGTGLGLSQVYGMARQGGGTVRIDSRPGLGTTVTIYLRRTDTGLDQGGAADHPERLPAIAAAHMLVVDDDADVRRVLVESFESLGHRVVDVDNGRTALERLSVERFDLLVVDFAMPGMTGAEVAEAARADWPDLPILFVSGYADTDAIERVAGTAASILRKPFLMSDLQGALAKVLATKPAEALDADRA